MLPATLVTLASFLLELANSSPVYNMQPAFVTAHIGSFAGRNIRNLPCISRKNPSQTGVCMFAIDCLKSNGTHLGTCIDRFYFGSCCHIEPHISENTIETEVMDIREPPVRLHNKTGSVSTTSTSKPALSNSTKINSTERPTVSSRKPTLVTKKPTVSNKKPISSKKPSATPYKKNTTSASSSLNPEILSSITKKPVKITTKRPWLSSTNKENNSDEGSINYSTGSSTAPEKLQTFQVIDGILVDTTTYAPYYSTGKRTVPTKIPTKLTISTSKPLTASIASSVPTITKPSSKPLPATKPTGKPIKTSKPTMGTKLTSKPTSSTKTTITTLRSTPSTASTSSKKHSKPTTEPAILLTSSTEKATTLTSRLTTTTKVSSAKEPENLTTTLSTKVSTSTLISSTISPIPQNVTRVPPLLVTTLSIALAEASKAPPQKPNVSLELEASGGNVNTNEIIYNAASSTTTIKPSGLVTWTLDDNKTSFLGGNVGVVLTNITEEWIPLNPQDSTSQNGWVLLPTATHHTSSKNKTTTIMPSVSHSSTIQILNVNISEQTSPMTTSSPLHNSSTTTKVSVEVSSASSVKPVVSTELPPAESVSQNDSFSFIWFTTITPQEPVITSSTEALAQVSSTVATPTEEANVTSTSLPSYISSSTESIASTEFGTTSSNISTGGNKSTMAIEATTEPELKPVNMSDFTDVCGRRMYPGARIVGGEKSAYGRWPWQISLRQWRTSTYLHKCGAALLNENWAITAAHCVDNVPPNDLLLRLGEYDLSTDSEPYLHQERRVQIVASHPQFDPSTFEYDLALLRFYEPVTFQPNILPVCVPRNDENFVGKTAYVTGWGRLYEDGPLPSILQEVSVPVINNSVCESMYRSAGYIEHIPNIFICAGWRRGGFDSCEGDSGGPMVLQREDKRFQLAGVISWGIGCAEPNQPGVYTRISEFRDWINQILQF